MAHFLIQASFNADALAKLVRKPQDRTDALRPVIEKLGGTLDGAWWSFGEYDVVVLCQMPDHVNAAAFAFAGAAGGALKAIKTTPLMSMQEGLSALSKAAESGYQPPA